MSPLPVNRLAIRDAAPSDAADLRRAVVELQECERRLHASRLPGEAIADPYLAWMLREAAAGEAGLARVRLYALAANRPARASYVYAGYAEYEIAYEKVIG